MGDSLALCFCPEFRGCSGRDGAFPMDFVKGVLGHFRHFAVSFSACFWYRCWCVLSGLKAPTAGVCWPIRAGKRKYSHVTANAACERGPIVLNGRKQALIDQTFGRAWAGSLLWNGKDGGRKGRRGYLVPSAISLTFCPLVVSLPNSVTRPFNHPNHTGASLWPELMGSCPRDGPVATFCFSSSKRWPNHHVGMLMCGALGLPIEMPICGRGQPGMRGENEALTPGPCQFEGVTGGWTAFSAWQCTLFFLCLAQSLSGGLGRERECKAPSHVLPAA